jgi:putative FmdB family regulatory protein
MPTYAYRCDNCGVEFERVQKFSDKPLTRCPECKGKVRRVPQAAGIVFKGSGWYIKDSQGASSSAKSSKKTESATSTDGGSKDNDTSAPKTEAKESKPAESTSKPAAAKE